MECGFLRMMRGSRSPIMDGMTSPPPTSARVLLADLAGPARRALASLLGELDGVELVGEAGGCDELSPALRLSRPDVLVIDDRLLRAAHATLPASVRVIVMGVDDDPAYADRARALGADAWLVKDRAGDDLPALLVA
jgi:DNA-binding NarL/FixJ family response regulator